MTVLADCCTVVAFTSRTGFLSKAKLRNPSVGGLNGRNKDLGKGVLSGS